jgi:thymidylate kinase
MKASAALYIFEGPDGVGKTTLSKWFAEVLQENLKQSVAWSSFPGKEDGSVGNLVYQLHHDSKKLGVETIHPRSLQLFHIAAHIDAIESRFKKSLQCGTHLVLDRFWWSTWVYGRFAGEPAAILDEMIALEKKAWGKINPKKIFLISRSGAETKTEAHDKLSMLYRQLAKKQSELTPVEYIINSGGLDKAKRQILSSIS